jgi:hypothetical protein
MQTSRKHIHMSYLIQPHRHIGASSMKTNISSHENILQHYKLCYACSCTSIILVSVSNAICRGTRTIGLVFLPWDLDPRSCVLVVGHKPPVLFICCGAWNPGLVYLTLWGLPWGSESLQLTPTKDLSFITLLRFYLQHRALAFTDLSVCIMLETCLDSHSVLCISLASMLMLHAQINIHLNFMIMLLTHNILINHKYFNGLFRNHKFHNLYLKSKIQ